LIPAASAITHNGVMAGLVPAIYVFVKPLAECKADKTWQIFVDENTGHDVILDQRRWLAAVSMKVS